MIFTGFLVDVRLSPNTIHTYMQSAHIRMSVWLYLGLTLSCRGCGCVLVMGRWVTVEERAGQVMVTTRLGGAGSALTSSWNQTW